MVSISGTFPARTCRSGSAIVMATPRAKLTDRISHSLRDFVSLAPHVVADAAHGHLRAERKESHSQDQHGGGQHKGQDKSCIHGNQEEADRKHDQTDRKNGSTGFSQLFQ